MSRSETASNAIGSEMEQFLFVLNREAIQALNAIQSHLQQFGSSKMHEFKMYFLKSAYLQLMAAYQRFEMQLMIRHVRILHDFPAMHPPLPPNMHMNTPSVVFVERKSNGTVSRSNGTPILLNVNHHSSDQNMDLDGDRINLNVNMINANGIDGRLPSTNTNDRIELRANGVEQSNRTKCAGNSNGNGNELLCTATNTFPGPSKMASNQFEAPNSCGRTLNAGKQDLSSTNVTTLVNGQGHGYYGADNGLCSSATSTSNFPNRFFNHKHNDRSDVSNNQVNVSAPTNLASFENGTNGSTNCSVVTNNAIGDPSMSMSMSNHENASNVAHSEAENALLAKWDGFIGAKNSSNDHQGVQTHDHSASASNGNGNDHEMASNVPHRINEKLNQNLPVSSASEQKNDDVPTNDHSMDVNDSGFVDDRFDDDGNNYAYTDTDSGTDTDDDERNVNDNLKTPATSKQQTKANLCETAQLAKNGDDEAGENKKFGSLNQHSSGQAYSVELQQKSGSTKNSKREWMCFYCHKVGEKNVESFIFSSFDEVYDHWKSSHSSDGSDTDAASSDGGAEALKPFRFYSVDLLCCCVDACSFYSTFRGLHRHHQKKHPNNLFVPIFNGRCALCFYTGDDLREHSCDSLDNVVQLQLCNPILLTDQELAELQAIDCQELKQNRTKHFECQYCDGFLGSRQEMIQHYDESHGAMTINYSDMIEEDDQSEVIALICPAICNCCQSVDEMPPNEYADHLKSTVQRHWKKKAIPRTWDSWYRRQEIQFLKTKVVFPNGLVLFHQNVIATDFGDHRSFKKFAKKIFDSLEWDGIEPNCINGQK